MNDFETRARAAKVAKLAALIPHGRTAPEIARIASAVEAATTAARAQFSERIGVRAPSDQTWTMVVAEVRSRLAPWQVMRTWKSISRGGVSL